MNSRVRGEQRFGAITYSLVAEWTGLRLSTVQAYGARRLFNPHDIEATIRWCNERRSLRGLPPIGTETPEIPDEPVETPLIEPKTPYNPLTGEFE